MKKFMKAIAFATVMCMLLSVAAFAADTAEWGETEATVDVVIEANEANANKQIALVVSTADSAAEIVTGNIKDVQQVALGDDGSLEITLGTGDATSANIFYGYEGRGAAGQLELAAQAVEPGDKVVVTVVDILTDAEIEAHVGLNDGYVLPETDNDKAGAIIAKVDVDVDAGRKIKKMFWSVRYKESAESETVEFAYVPANASLFEVLDGETQIGLAFSNGNQSGRAEVVIDTLHAIVLTGEEGNTEKDLTIYSDANKADIANNPSLAN